MSFFEGWIYLIYNTHTKRSYIGQTVNIQKRIHEHFTGKGSKPLYESILKQRAKGYKVYILNKSTSKRELDMQETYYIKKYQAAEHGYNIEKGNARIKKSYRPSSFDSYEYDASIDHEYYEKLELVRMLRQVWMRERHIEQNKIINAIFDNNDETIAKVFPKFETWQDIRDFAHKTLE